MHKVSERKPRFALVADFVGSDKAYIHERCKEMADIRYLDAPAKFSNLKEFNSNGGRVVVWVDHSPHEWESRIKAMGVSYHKHMGTLPSIPQYIKETVEKLRGLR